MTLSSTVAPASAGHVRSPVADVGQPLPGTACVETTNQRKERVLSSFFPRVKRVAAATAIIAGLSSVALATSASAGIENYCVGTLQINDECVGARHSLRSNQVFGNGQWIGARANDSGGAPYGSYISGTQYACHPYSGSNLLYPVIGHFFYYYSIGAAGTQAYGVDSQGC